MTHLFEFLGAFRYEDGGYDWWSLGLMCFIAYVFFAALVAAIWGVWQSLLFGGSLRRWREYKTARDKLRKVGVPARFPWSYWLHDTESGASAKIVIGFLGIFALLALGVFFQPQIDWVLSQLDWVLVGLGNEVVAGVRRIPIWIIIFGLIVLFVVSWHGVRKRK